VAPLVLRPAPGHHVRFLRTAPCCTSLAARAPEPHHSAERRVPSGTEGTSMSHDEILLSHINDFDVAEFYSRKAAWSRETFGTRQTTDGVIAHLRKELAELEGELGGGNAAGIREELADICLLAIDLSWRAGGTAADFRRTSICTRITPIDAADYIDRHLSSTMPPAALAALLWDIAFRALGSDAAPIEAKLVKIKTRKIPDWRTVPADQPIEHVQEIDDAIAEDLVAPLLAERSALQADLDRVRAAIHPLKDEAVGTAAARVWGEFLTAHQWLHGMRDGVLRALGRSDEDPVMAATWVMAAHKEEVAKLTAALKGRTDLLDVALAERDAMNDVLAKIRKIVGAEHHDDVAVAVLRWLDAVVEARGLLTERTEWRANNDALRLERDDVRKILSAQPHESVAMAAQRAVELIAVRDSMAAADDERVNLARSLYRALSAALDTAHDASAGAIIGRARRLQDDSAAYHSLRARLVGVLGAEADFSDSDLIDLIEDRIGRPLSDAESALEEQVEKLEDDLRTTLDALHIATGRRS
ncbi:MAG: hypothetical protein ACRCU1_01010, partial [Alsobacter sp.]